MTRLYIDSAAPQEWAEAVQCGLIRRATCNPLLMDAAPWRVNLNSVQQLWQAAQTLGLEELHLQAWPDEQGDWWPVAQAIAQLSPRIVVKLPAVPAAFKAAVALKKQGTRVLITAISNPLHGLWAAEAGADFVAPYVGRLSEAGQDAHGLIDTLVALQQRQGPTVLAASVRDLTTLGRLIQQGVGAVTLRKSLLDAGLADPATLTALAQFEAVRLKT
ncbi:MAG: Fructose-6-phosphate aldolase 1 [Pseudomonadota bacterium]